TMTKLFACGKDVVAGTGTDQARWRSIRPCPRVEVSNPGRLMSTELPASTAASQSFGWFCLTPKM
ncbi:MAG: hypothetical protein ACYDEY_15750, partial [Acidimicrobiales bacterium]